MTTPEGEVTQEVKRMEKSLRLPSSGDVAKRDRRTTGHVKKLSVAMERLGLVGISTQRLQAFQQLGIEVEPAGLIRDSRAGAMVAQQVALDVLLDLKRLHDAASDKGKVRLVPHIGFMVRALAAANRGAGEAAGGIPSLNNNLTPGTASVVVHTMIPLNTGVPDPPRIVDAAVVEPDEPDKVD